MQYRTKDRIWSLPIKEMKLKLNLFWEYILSSWVTPVLINTLSKEAGYSVNEDKDKRGPENILKVCILNMSLILWKKCYKNKQTSVDNLHNSYLLSYKSFEFLVAIYFSQSQNITCPLFSLVCKWWFGLYPALSQVRPTCLAGVLAVAEGSDLTNVFGWNDSTVI